MRQLSENGNGPIQTIVELPNGQIMVGGDFTKVNDTVKLGLARLNSDGSVAYDSDQNWVGPELEPISKEKWPQNREQLFEWALSRMEVHFDKCWNSAILDWKSSPNRIGKSEDIDPEEGRQMITAGINLHLDQVELCLKENGGPNLESWRSGDFRPEWPAPDGFPKNWKSAKINPRQI